MLKNRYDVLLLHVQVAHLNHRQFHQMIANSESLGDLAYPQFSWGKMLVFDINLSFSRLASISYLKAVSRYE